MPARSRVTRDSTNGTVVFRREEDRFPHPSVRFLHEPVRSHHQEDRLPREQDHLRAVLAAHPGDLRTALTLARLDIDNDLHGHQVTSLVRGIESALKHESQNVYRVDVVPLDAAAPQP